MDALRLIRSENVGTITFFQLVKRFGTCKAALAAIPELSIKGGRKQPITICSKEKAEAEIEATNAFSAQLIRYGEAAYPELLMDIYDPPPVIAMRGNANVWQKECLAMVGSRNASTNGVHFARKLADTLGKEGYTITSGLARGIDTAVHTGSLESGTVAVIAGGIDNIYPPENGKLYDAIADKGAIISEYPFGQEPFSRAFPARNRIISGMSKGTIVVEASVKSGSLITARMALEQGRDVFAVPGSPLDSRCRGSNLLLKQGAVVTENVDDVTSYLNATNRLPISEAEPPSYTNSPPAIPSEDELQEARELIKQSLSFEPTPMDELIAHTGVSTHVVLIVLLEMELAGTAKRSTGGKVSLIES
jgi:DNA processing protein